MNLHYSTSNGKGSFLKKFLLGLTNENNHYNNEELLRQGLTVSSNPDSSKNNLDNFPNQKRLKPLSLEGKLIRLFDRVGRLHLHDFTAGNICVFGDDEWEVESCSIQLLSRFASIGYVVEVIDANEVSPEILTNSGTPLLIKIAKRIPFKLMKDIIQACPSICLLKLMSSNIVCSLNSRIKSSPYIKELITSLGGNCYLRELLIASLTEDEFLLIENTPLDRDGSQSVRCFQTIIKQSL